jgi:mRNA interferase MazF
MPSYSRSDVVLVRYPFSDLTSAKVRPAVVVSVTHPRDDYLIVPLTSRVADLQPGEFVLSDWRVAGLNVASAVKRGIYTIHASLVLQAVGQLSSSDARQVDESLRRWLGLS